MMLGHNNFESPNLINDIQLMILKQSYSSYSMEKQVASSDDPSVGGQGDGGGKRQRVESFYETTVGMMFPGSPMRSTEGGGFPEDIEVSGQEAAQQAEEMRRSICVSHGWVSVIGRRRAMEDAIVVVPDLIAGELLLSAVYDGHRGSRVSNLCRAILHQFLLKEIKEGNNKEGELDRKINWKKVMMDCFKKMNEEVVNCATSIDEDEAGSTAVVAVIGKEMVVVANCGDSRVVLSRGSGSMALSRDHKPDRPDEKERVEASGGSVTKNNGSGLCGVLSTSRSIGDKYLKPYAISDPEVTVTKRTESDQFLIIASNGLWDVMSNEVACDIVTKCFSGKIAKNSENSNDACEAAAKLAELAIAKGSKDNISVIVVELNKYS